MNRLPSCYELSRDIQHHYIPLLHRWVNEKYAERFWQLKGTASMFESTYRSILDNPAAHSFIGFINDAPCCQIDLYAVAIDELAEHIEADQGDCGAHILMCPPEQKQRGWSTAALKTFVQYYFSFEQASRLFIEPDEQNRPANQLAIKAGFAFLKTIALSSKTANLYCMTREQFTHPLPR